MQPLIDGALPAASDAVPDMLPELVLYFREGCHLCEDMEQLLGELLEPGSFRLTRVDIDEHPSLREAYNVRVPVLSLVRTPLCAPPRSPLRAPLIESTDADSRLVQVQTAGTPLDHLPDNQMELCEHFLDLEAVRDALASYNRQLLAVRGSPAE